jgi:hypothetical protein
MFTEECGAGHCWSDVHCGGCHDRDRTAPCQGQRLSADEYRRLRLSSYRPTLLKHLWTWWRRRHR